MPNSSIPSTSAEATEMINGFLGNLKVLISSPAKGAKEIVEHGNFIISAVLSKDSQGCTLSCSGTW